MTIVISLKDCIVITLMGGGTMKRKLGAYIVGAAFSLALTACGGSGGGSGGVAPETPDEPDVIDVGETDDTGVVVGSQSPELLGAGAVRSGFVAAGESEVFRVPSDSTVSLTSTGGDADLFLFSSDEFTVDTLLCNAGNYWQEENCTASDPDGEMFAEVFARTATSFSINVSNDCSVGAINEWVNRNMQDYYLFADNVPVVNPANFANPSALMNALRFPGRDPFSGVSDAAVRQAFLEAGQSFGMGFRWSFDSEGNARILQVYEESPFGIAGINRGDTVTSINGEPWREIGGTPRFGELIGDVDNPLTNTWQVIDGVTGAASSVSLTASEFTVNTVIHTEVYTNPAFSGSTGYLVFDSFLRTSEAELDAAIADFANAGVTELVLDLRYNGGGFISIATRLASQIAGPDFDGDLLTIYEYNDEYTAQNFPLLLDATTPTLDLDRLVVLTTQGSASASELLINGLRPYMDVVVIGDATSGKPFISQSKQFCGVALDAMEAEGFNASGVSVGSGIAADCFAQDDPSRDFGGGGLEIEGMLLSALDYVVFGTCDAPQLAKRAISANHSDDTPVLGAIRQ